LKETGERKYVIIISKYFIRGSQILKGVTRQFKI